MSIGNILGGSSLIGGAFQALGANKAGKTAAKGFQVGGQQAEEALNAGYNDAIKYLMPYAQFGEQQLPMLQQLAQQPDFNYGDFFNSQQFADMSALENERVARQAQAGIGVRSGQGQTALASIAPQLAMQERQYQNQQNQQRFGNIFNLAQFGAGFGQNAAQMYANKGNALADYRYNAATGGAGARAQGQNAMFQGFGNMIGDVGTGLASSQAGLFDPNFMKAQALYGRRG